MGKFTLPFWTHLGKIGSFPFASPAAFWTRLVNFCFPGTFLNATLLEQYSPYVNDEKKMRSVTVWSVLYSRKIINVNVKFNYGRPVAAIFTCFAQNFIHLNVWQIILFYQLSCHLFFNMVCYNAWICEFVAMWTKCVWRQLSLPTISHILPATSSAEMS